MTDRLEIVYRPLDSLIPYARNPRKNDPVVDGMASGIKEFGFRYPILVKSDGSVVDGHLRIKAAAKLGMTEVPTVCADDMTEAQIKAFRLYVNRIPESVAWDDDLLRLELEELKEMDFDMELTGFDMEELGELLMGLSEGEPGVEHQSLADRFGVPPFSVLDARQGYWQERKKAWLALGIQSELGRGGGENGLLGFSKQSRTYYK